jgi:ABC-2 type transport system permease protein
MALTLFVLSLAGLFFFVGYPVGPAPLPGLWSGGQASLATLFSWLPLLFAFFVPALAMTTWSLERSSGTEELLLTHPVRTREVVVGKFLAIWFIIALLASSAVIPIAITVAFLGDLDWSTVGVGLCGALMLGAAYAALALCISAATAEPLVAYLLGALLLLSLWLLRMLVDVFPGAMAATLEYASPTSHFLESAARGVFDPRDAVYFASLVLAGLYLNVVMVERRRWS